MKKISVLVSGGGSNLQAIIDAIDAGRLEGCRVVKVISSKSGVYALERAKVKNIKSAVIEKGLCEKEFADCLLGALEEDDPDLIVLAGYLKILPKEVIERFPKKIINIHPSLIPKYCGKGFYGMKVHEAVVASRESESGATVHFVDAGIDTGEIILQKRVQIDKKDEADDVARKVLEVEHEILPAAIAEILLGGKER